MKTLKVIASISAATLLLAGCRQYEYPFQNPKLGVEERVDNLMSLLTPEEKVGLMMNGSISIDRLGIPAYNWWSEATTASAHPTPPFSLRQSDLQPPSTSPSSLKSTPPFPMRRAQGGTPPTTTCSARQKLPAEPGIRA